MPRSNNETLSISTIDEIKYLSFQASRLA